MSGLLDRINFPEDLKAFSHEELKRLGEEIRKYIIEVVSKRGGHLASSLGCVEITLALYYVFNAPRDRIVWDVGHQSYTHKILTGRKEQFIDLRTRGGISGFPCISESEYDIFGVGHASTAISAALGIAAARDIKREDYFVISVVGDAALSGGMAFEAINQAGHLRKNRFVIILNDNEMSISRTVGAMSKYLTKITTKELYLRLEADVWELLGKIPTLGGKAQTLARRIKESIKNLVVPNILFEELGFRYYGPLDGHDLDELVETFSNLHQVPGPVLVHVVSKKGKGYTFAENDAEKFHGVGSFYKTTGNSKSNAQSPKYSDVFGETMVELGRSDKKVVAITAAMKEGTGLSNFAERYPDRFFDVGIAEQHAVTFAAGLARAGLKPFVVIYSTFLQRGFDQIIHDVALQKLPVRFILDRGGVVGEDGPTHHGSFDLSYLRLIPGMILMAPSDEEELRRMLLAALLYDKGPIAMRFPRGAAVGVELSEKIVPIELGTGKLLRKGSDATIIAVGSMVGIAGKAAAKLADGGVEASVINARFIKPLDEDLILSSIGPNTPVFTLEENAKIGGFGDAVSALLSDRGLENRMIRIGIPDHFVPHGRREDLLDEMGLSPEKIAQHVMKVLHTETPSDHGGVGWT